MHFALPPRKTSQPPPFARVHARYASNARRRMLQLASYAVLGIFILYVVFYYLFHSIPPHLDISDSIPPNPDITIVTVLDPSAMSENYMSMIRRNRDDYAHRHNYHNFYTNVSTYAQLISPSPSSWSLVPALRHALEHLIQWQSSITTHLALVPQRLLNSYNFAFPTRKISGPDGHFLKDPETAEDILREHDSMWSEGDFVVNFKGCGDFKAREQSRDCEQEMTAYFKRWLKEIERLDGPKTKSVEAP